MLSFSETTHHYLSGPSRSAGTCGRSSAHRGGSDLRRERASRRGDRGSQCACQGIGSTVRSVNEEVWKGQDRRRLTQPAPSALEIELSLSVLTKLASPPSPAYSCGRLDQLLDPTSVHSSAHLLQLEVRALGRNEGVVSGVRDEGVRDGRLDCLSGGVTDAVESQNRSAFIPRVQLISDQLTTWKRQGEHRRSVEGQLRRQSRGSRMVKRSAHKKRAQ